MAKPKGSDTMGLPGKHIVVKYAEGDFHGTIVRRVSTNKFVVRWEGDTAEDSTPILLDPKKCGKQFKADQNGWEIVGDDAEEVAPPSPAHGKRTTNSVKRSLNDGGTKVKITYSEAAPAPSPAKRPKSSHPTVCVQDQLAYIRLKLGQTSNSLNPALAAAEVKEFETAHGITLPSEYREFVQNVSNGGPGGLSKLSESVEQGSTLATAWPFTAAGLPAADQLYLGYPSVFTKPALEGSPDLISAPEKALAEQFQRPDGLLLLGGTWQEQCKAYLCVTGEARGAVWMVGPDHFGPFQSPDGTGFLAWFLQWLDEQAVAASS